jgi:hypothetical protein
MQENKVELKQYIEGCLKLFKKYFCVYIIDNK